MDQLRGTKGHQVYYEETSKTDGKFFAFDPAGERIEHKITILYFCGKPKKGIDQGRTEPEKPFEKYIKIVSQEEIEKKLHVIF